MQGPETVVFWIPAACILLINMLSFCTMWWDKRRAQNHQWRVAEATLLLTGFLGGAVGLVAGMYRFRHKTRNRRFQIASLIAFIASLIVYWIVIVVFYI